MLSGQYRKLISPHQLSSRPTTIVHQVVANGFLKNRYSSPPIQNINRSFHSCRPLSHPIGPLPTLLTGLYKSGVLTGLISYPSKTYLTARCMYARQGKYKKALKMLRWIPLASVGLLLASGLELAPNTKRIRLSYLSEEEEYGLSQIAYASQYGHMESFMARKDSNVVVWLQNIVDNLAQVAGEDIQAPVRQRNPPLLLATEGSTETTSTSGQQQQESPLKFTVDFVCDSNILNAKICGRSIFVHGLMLAAMDYDETKMAVILSHEVAHSIQRHMAEQHGFLSFFFILADIARGVLWQFTDEFGPYFNESLSQLIKKNFIMESQTSYNRVLEYEADLVGLFLVAKAGYDPRVAIEVWTNMAQYDTQRRQANEEGKTTEKQEKNQVLEGIAILNRLCTVWFGETHPRSLDRVKHLEKYMDQAVAVYEKAVRVNGKVVCIPLENPILQRKSSKKESAEKVSPEKESSNKESSD